MTSHVRTPAGTSAGSATRTRVSLIISTTVEMAAKPTSSRRRSIGASYVRTGAMTPCSPESPRVVRARISPRPKSTSAPGSMADTRRSTAAAEWVGTVEIGISSRVVMPPAAAAAPAALKGPRGEPQRTRRYSPVVLKLATERGVDLALVQGTGIEGRVTRQDVLRYLAVRTFRPVRARRDAQATDGDDAEAEMPPADHDAEADDGARIDESESEAAPAATD